MATTVPEVQQALLEAIKTCAEYAGDQYDDEAQKMAAAANQFAAAFERISPFAPPA